MHALLDDAPSSDKNASNARLDTRSGVYHGLCLHRDGVYAQKNRIVGNRKRRREVDRWFRAAAVNGRQDRMPFA